MVPYAETLPTALHRAEKHLIQRWMALSFLVALAVHGLAAWISPPYAPSPYRLAPRPLILVAAEPILEIPAAPRPIERPVLPSSVEIAPDAPVDVFFPPAPPGWLAEVPPAAPSLAAPLPATLAPHFDTPPRVLHSTAPVYPDLARAAGAEGVVHLLVTVDENGRVAAVEVLRAEAIEPLVQAALEAMRQWIFTPARQGDRPVAVRVVVPIQFALH